MKKFVLVLCVVACITACAPKQQTVFTPRGAPAAQSGMESGSSGDTPAAVVAQRGRDSRTWKREMIETLRNGRSLRRTNTFMELGTGLHYRDPADGQLKEAREEIEITADGAKADKLAHKVHFKGNINSAAAFTITTSDNKTLRATVRGLAYTEPVGGQVVMFAPVRDSTGVHMPPNAVVYPNAFTGTRADVRAIVTKARFESDVILREKLPPPGDWNLDPATTLLEVWTEFEAPEPRRTIQTRAGLSDETLDFGAMRMGRGTAFALDLPEGRRRDIPVAKTWMTTAEGKTYLIESVRYSLIAQELARLPDRQAALAPDAPVLRAASRLLGLAELVPPANRSPSPVGLAFDRALLERSPGLVLDFMLSTGSQTNFTFQADTTYLINGEVNFFGETTFEGATVVKFATTNTSFIRTWSNVVFKTDFYRPAIFTSQMDGSVGQDFSAPGAPMYYHNALTTDWEGTDYHHIRIKYADLALRTRSPKVRHAQFLYGYEALTTEEGTAEVDNVLITDCWNAFGGFQFNTSARHVTVNRCARLGFDNWEVPELPSFLAITNSLLANVTNTGNATLTTNATVFTTDAAFQTVGAGAHYLADNSPYRDVGIANLPAALAADLKKLTTYPPVVLNGVIAQDTTLGIAAPRDTDTPDLGWHGPPLDYFINSIWITNSTVVVSPGVGIGVGAPGTYPFFATLLQGGSFICEGQADNLNHIAAWPLVQETAPTNFTAVMTLFQSPNAGSSPPPELMRLRFTEITVPPTVPTAVIIGTADPMAGVPPMAILDSQIYGGRINLEAGPPVAFTNNLLFRVSTEPFVTDYSHFRNNTFFGGSVLSYFNTTNGGFYDNIFDSVSFHPETANTPNSHNTYTTNAVNWGRLSPTGANDVLVNSINWQSGPLGAFYLPTNSPAINAGSRNADVAGLYHFTSTTNQVKEASSAVDLGFHYVAASPTGIPLDYDGDAVPDYREDGNGNGAFDSAAGETDWGTYNSANQLSTSPSLQVFTPLK